MEKCRFSQKLQGTNTGYFSTATKLTFRRSGSELDLAFEPTTSGYRTNSFFQEPDHLLQKTEKSDIN